MNDLIGQITSILIGGGLLLWFGKILFIKSLETRLAIEKEKLNLVRHADLEFKKAQVKELYGPLYGILKTSRKIYDLWMDRKLDGINSDVKQLFKMNNEKANKIIIDNVHLIEESPMPECFLKYVSSTLVWSMYCADSEESELPPHLKNHPDVEWCVEFEEYIFSTYEKLAAELAVLYKKYQVK